jgi:hypothetical protein
VPSIEVVIKSGDFSAHDIRFAAKNNINGNSCLE